MQAPRALLAALQHSSFALLSRRPEPPPAGTTTQATARKDALECAALPKREFRP